jgi:hypothetical protein
MLSKTRASLLELGWPIGISVAILSISGLALYGLIAIAERHSIYWQT